MVFYLLLIPLFRHFCFFQVLQRTSLHTYLLCLYLFETFSRLDIERGIAVLCAPLWTNGSLKRFHIPPALFCCAHVTISRERSSDPKRTCCCHSDNVKELSLPQCAHCDHSHTSFPVRSLVTVFAHFSTRVLFSY